MLDDEDFLLQEFSNMANNNSGLVTTAATAAANASVPVAPVVAATAVAASVVTAAGHHNTVDGPVVSPIANTVIDPIATGPMANIRPGNLIN